MQETVDSRIEKLNQNITALQREIAELQREITKLDKEILEKKKDPLLVTLNYIYTAKGFYFKPELEGSSVLESIAPDLYKVLEKKRKSYLEGKKTVTWYGDNSDRVYNEQLNRKLFDEFKKKELDPIIAVKNTAILEKEKEKKVKENTLTEKNQKLYVLQSNLHKYTLQKKLELKEEKRKLREEELKTKLDALESKVKAFMHDTAAIVIEDGSQIVNEQTEISATTDNIAETLDTGAICDDQKLVDQEELTSLKFFRQHPLRFLLQCLIDIRRRIFPSPNDTHTIEKYGSITSITVGKSIAGKPCGIPDDVWWEYEKRILNEIMNEIMDEENCMDNPEYKVEYELEYIDNDKKKSKEIESLLKEGEELLAECEAFYNKYDARHKVECWQETILRGKGILKQERRLIGKKRY